MSKDVETNVKAKVEVTGAKEAASQMKVLGAAGTAALLELATGGSKVRAVFEAIKWGAFAKAGVAGFAALSTGVLALVGSVRKLLVTTGALETALKRVEDIEIKTTQFQSLLKGAQLAKQRLEELVKFAAKTPFQLPEIAEASRMLEIMGKGALSSTKHLKMVGDAAAVSGRGMQEVAFWVGRLYDGIQAGRPIGEAATRLQEMGLITGKTRGQIEDLTKAGGDMTIAWRMVNEEMELSEGAMEKLSETVGGLKTTLSDTKDLLAIKFGDPFAALEKEKIKSHIKVLQNLGPTIEKVGRDFAMVENVLEGGGIGRWFKEAVTGSEFLMGALVLLIRTILVAGAAATALVIIKMAPVLLGVATAAGLAATSTKGYALATTWAERGTFGWLAASKAMTGSLWVLNKVAGIVGATLKMVFSPITLIFAAVAAVWSFVDSQMAAAKAQKEFADATSEINSELERMIHNMQTVDQKTKTYAKVTNELAKAQVELAEKMAKVKEMSREDGWAAWNEITQKRRNAVKEMELARDRVHQLQRKQRQVEAVPDSLLGKSAEEKEIEKEVRERGRKIEKEKFDEHMGRVGLGRQIEAIGARRSKLIGEIDEGQAINHAKANEGQELARLRAAADAADSAFQTIAGDIKERGGKGRSFQDIMSSSLDRTYGEGKGMRAYHRSARVFDKTPSKAFYQINKMASGGWTGNTGAILDAMRQQQVARRALAAFTSNSQSSVTRDSQLMSDIRSMGYDMGGGMGRISPTVLGDRANARMGELGFGKDSEGYWSFSQRDLNRVDASIASANENAKSTEKKLDEDRKLAAQARALELRRKEEKISLQLAKELVAIETKGMDAFKRENQARQDALMAQRDLVKDTNELEKQAIETKVEGLQKALRLEEKRVNEMLKSLNAAIKIEALSDKTADAFVRRNFREAGAANDQRIKMQEAEITRKRYKDLVENQNIDPADTRRIVKDEADNRRNQRTQRANAFRAEQGDAVKMLRLQAGGQAHKVQQIKDMDRFKEIFKEGIESGLGVNEAGRIARARTQAEIALDGQVAPIADSLARIGGGGNVAGNPLLNVAQRQEKLLENIRDLMLKPEGARNEVNRQIAVLK